MPEAKYTTTSIQVPPAHLATLQTLASRHGVTVSAVVRWAITAYLAHPASEAGAPQT